MRALASYMCEQSHTYNMTVVTTGIVSPIQAVDAVPLEHTRDSVPPEQAADAVSLERFEDARHQNRLEMDRWKMKMLD